MDLFRNPGRGLPLAGRVGAIVFGVVWLGFLSVFFRFLVPQIAGELRKAVSYEPADGTVTACTPPVERTDDSGQVSRTPGRIEYAYRAAGQARTGTHKQPGPGAPRNEHARKLLGPIEEGSTVRVWYDPADPNASTLEPVAEPHLLGFLIFLLPFAAVGVSSLVCGLTGRAMPVEVRKPSSRGQPRIRPRGMAVYLPVYFVLSAAGAFGFLAGAGSLPWKAAWVVGAALGAVVIPALTFAITRAVTRRIARGAPAGEHRPAPGEPTGTPGPPPADAGADDDAPGDATFPRLRKRLALMLVFTLLWNGLTGVFVGIVARSFVKHHRAETRFAATQGVVLASKVERHSGDSDSGPTYRPVIRYRYDVGGRSHTSTRYSFSLFGTSNRAWAAGVVRNHPQGKAVTVYYDPDDPAEAVLHREVPSLSYFLVLFLQPFVVAGLALLAGTVWLAVAHVRARRFVERASLPQTIPGWGRFGDEPSGYTITPPRSVVPPIVALLAGYGVTCFLCIFPVAMLGDPEEVPARTVWLILAGAGGVGLAAAVAACLRAVRKAVLYIDPRLKEIRLTSGRRDVRLDFAQIDHWLVRTVREPSTSAGSRGRRTRRPLLALQPREGPQVPVRLFGNIEEAAHVARKAGRLLAELTGSRFGQAAPPSGAPDAGPGPVQGPDDSRAALRAYRRFRREYADLM